MPEARLFSKEPKERLYLRTIQSWTILVGRAYNRQTINYKALATLMTGGAKSSLGKRAGQWKGIGLGYLYTYCKERDLPLLPVIVVKKKRGLPAEKAPYERNEISTNTEVEKVFEFDWFSIFPPTEAEIQSIYSNREHSHP